MFEDKARSQSLIGGFISSLSDCKSYTISSPLGVHTAIHDSCLQTQHKVINFPTWTIEYFIIIRSIHVPCLLMTWLLMSPDHQNSYWLCKINKAPQNHVYILWHNCCHTDDNIDGLVQKRHNSTTLAMELHLSCTKPSIFKCLCIRTKLNFLQLSIMLYGWLIHYGLVTPNGDVDLCPHWFR